MRRAPPPPPPPPPPQRAALIGTCSQGEGAAAYGHLLLLRQLGTAPRVHRARSLLLSHRYRAQVNRAKSYTVDLETLPEDVDLENLPDVRTRGP